MQDTTRTFYRRKKSGEFSVPHSNRILESELQQIQHLSNIICGINHEISPWLGGISNISARLQTIINDLNINSPKDVEAIKSKCKYKLSDIQKACEQAVNILSMLSRNVKKIQTYSVGEYNVKETVESWVTLILMDKVIKASISENNVYVNKDSLNFTVMHSPMLLSQIILNLSKNSIDHNQHMLDSLKINIYGKDNCLIYEDNGKGIPEDQLDNMFQPGITTKYGEMGQHGFGLAISMDYCVSMGAMMWAESDGKSYTRFIINFDFEHKKSNSKKKKNITDHFSAIKKSRYFLSDNTPLKVNRNL